MNHLKLITLPFILLGFLLCTSCSDDEDLGTPLKFEKTSYEARNNYSTAIQLQGGSQSYSLKVENSNLLKASILTYEAKFNPGVLSIERLKKGTTTVTVIDTKRQEEITLSIKIVDFYTSISINESNHPVLAENQVLFIVKNPAKDFYLFQVDEKTKEVNNKPLSRGTYELYAVEATPYLTLTYVDETNEETVCKLNLSENISPVLRYFNNYFQLDWEEWLSSKSRASLSSDFDVIMIEEGTEYKIKGDLEKDEMPDGILD